MDKTRAWLLAATALGLALFLAADHSEGQVTPSGRGCNQSVVYDASTNGTTQLFPLANGAGNGSPIYICGYTIFGGGTANVELDANTVTSCGGITTKLTPAYNITTQIHVDDTSPFFRGMVVPVNQVLCLKTSAGVAIQAIVFFHQDTIF